MNIVIDADGLLYRSGFAAEKREYHVHGIPFDTKGKAKDFMREHEIAGEPIVFVHAEPVENCLHTLKLQINKIVDAIKAEYGKAGQVLVVLSGSENYRYGIATIRPYKGNRDPEHKPIYMQQMKDYLKQRFGAIESVGVEADDVIAQLGTKNRGRAVLAGMDKDLLQVPGTHYDFLHDLHLNVSDEDGLCNLYEQIISGDSTDNIVGCYRLGKRGAEALVFNIRGAKAGAGLPALEQALYAGALNCYEQSIEKFGSRCPYHGMTAQDALHETARLVYLKRSKDDEWKPPK